jgi:hypothetical protein
METMSKKKRSAAVERLTKQLDRLEQSWNGQTIGIGYDADTGEDVITITLEPTDDPVHGMTITARVADVTIGTGDEN